MHRHIIEYTTEANWLKARSADVTSTEVAALFGMSPYMTAYKLYHIKKGNLSSSFEESERMSWGKRLESSIAQGIADEHNLEIRKMSEYIRLPDFRMGSSFDYAIGDKAILEIKNVGAESSKKWYLSDGKSAAPPHIELQCQYQLAVSGRETCYIGALFGGNRSVLIKRQRNEELIVGIFEKVQTFWHMFDNCVEPEADVKTDSKTMLELNSYAEPGKMITGDEDLEKLCSEYKKVSENETILQKQKNQLKALILQRVGDAETAIVGKYTISAGLVAPAQVSYERKGYRLFKVSKKGGSDE